MAANDEDEQMSKTYRFIIVSADGDVKATDDETIARDFAESDEHFVIEPATNLWLGLGGDDQIKPYRPRKESQP